MKQSFGYDEGKQYKYRRAAYAIIQGQMDDQIAVIQVHNHYFLPGGGSEAEESAEACVKRESLEEIGLEVEVQTSIGEAMQYFYSPRENIHYCNDASFFHCIQVSKRIHHSEADHKLIWMTPAEAEDVLFHPHQVWAVKAFRNK